jgi:hypothetical protein
MILTSLGVLAIVAITALGYKRGLYRIAAAFAALFLAALLAQPVSALFGGLLERVAVVPKSLAPLTAQLVAALLLFAAFSLCAERVLRALEGRREQAGKPQVALWARIGGAVLGSAWGLFLVLLVLIGLHLIGTVEEVLTRPAPAAPAAAKPRAAAAAHSRSAAAPAGAAAATKAAPAPAGSQAKAPQAAPPASAFVALRNGIDRSAFGPVVQWADPVGSTVKGIFQNLTIVMNNPNLYEQFTRHPDIARFTQHPKMQALSEDQQIQTLLREKRYYELLDDAKIAELLNDEALFKSLRAVKMGEILEQLLAKNAGLYAPDSAGGPLRRCPNCLGSDGQYKELLRSEQEAMRLAVQRWNQSGRSPTVYKCPFGNGWHLRQSP